MTDIPEVYFAEALRRLNDRQLQCFNRKNHSSQILASTLQELGWTPPIDEARMAKARKVAAAVMEATLCPSHADDIRKNKEHPDSYGEFAIQAAYKALGED